MGTQPTRFVLESEQEFDRGAETLRRAPDLEPLGLASGMTHGREGGQRICPRDGTPWDRTPRPRHPPGTQRPKVVSSTIPQSTKGANRPSTGGRVDRGGALPDPVTPHTCLLPTSQWSSIAGSVILGPSSSAPPSLRVPRPTAGRGQESRSRLHRCTPERVRRLEPC